VKHLSNSKGESKEKKRVVASEIEGKREKKKKEGGKDSGKGKRRDERKREYCKGKEKIVSQRSSGSRNRETYLLHQGSPS